MKFLMGHLVLNIAVFILQYRSLTLAQRTISHPRNKVETAN